MERIKGSISGLFLQIDGKEMVNIVDLPKEDYEEFLDSMNILRIAYIAACSNRHEVMKNQEPKKNLNQSAIAKEKFKLPKECIHGWENPIYCPETDKCEKCKITKSKCLPLCTHENTEKYTNNDGGWTIYCKDCGEKF